MQGYFIHNLLLFNKIIKSNTFAQNSFRQMVWEGGGGWFFAVWKNFRVRLSVRGGGVQNALLANLTGKHTPDKIVCKIWICETWKSQPTSWKSVVISHRKMAPWVRNKTLPSVWKSDALSTEPQAPGSAYSNYVIALLLHCSEQKKKKQPKIMNNIVIELIELWKWKKTRFKRLCHVINVEATNYYWPRGGRRNLSFVICWFCPQYHLS